MRMGMWKASIPSISPLSAVLMRRRRRKGSRLRAEARGMRANTVLACSKTRGGSTVIVLDCSLQMQMGHRLFLITLAVAAASVIVALAILVPLSSRVMRPFVQNIARQRRFVTDASHELKTPLAIVSANLDLIEAIAADEKSDKSGGCNSVGDATESSCAENEPIPPSGLSQELAPWIGSAKAQIVRMDSLVKGMVELSKADEVGRFEEGDGVDMGLAAKRAVDEFGPLADGRGLRIESEIQCGSMAVCSSGEADRILSILLDNAVKYCEGDGCIEVGVRCRRKTVELVVRNPCEALRQEDVPHMFERFWRADASRSRETGGFGIGLATVKAIVERHGGKAAAALDSGVIAVSITLPASRRP